MHVERGFYIGKLIAGYLKNELTVEEQLILDNWAAGSPANARLLETLKDTEHLSNELHNFNLSDSSELRERILSAVTPGQISGADRRFVTYKWLRYAATLLLIAGVSVIAYFLPVDHKAVDTASGKNELLKADVAPGGERAILTLADGTEIILDSASNGSLAHQGSVAVVKLSDGKIVYEASDRGQKEVMWNTMTTPAGGQYQIVLPDGTRVWLNAASSITFPTAFRGDRREVKIKGEIYFEVTSDKQKPFIVDVDGKSVVEVLGTNFNINSYRDEGSIKTTLLKGSVKVSKTQPGASASSYDNRISSVTLKPGQQAAIAMNTYSGPVSKNDAGIVVRSDADLDQTMGWKNGLFNFNGLDLKAVMRQLERWYDIRVEYRGSVDKDTFKGKIDRSVNLSDVLDILEEAGGVQFKLEGKTLTVLQGM